MYQIVREARPSQSTAMRLERRSAKESALVSTEHFRDLVRKPQTGTLKVFVTRVPRPRLFDGMVSEGKRLLSLGVDAVIALDGEQQNVDYPTTHVVPAREVSFKKSTFREMDYEAILRRSPEVVIVDNLLHVNISVSGNEMRYHNVRDLLDQGISIVTSAYSAFGNHLRTALEYVSRNFPAPFEKSATLPDDDIFTVVFSPRVTLHNAEHLTFTGDILDRFSRKT